MIRFVFTSNYPPENMNRDLLYCDVCGRSECDVKGDTWVYVPDEGLYLCRHCAEQENITIDEPVAANTNITGAE